MKKFTVLILFLLIISGVSAQSALTVSISFLMNKTNPPSYTFSTDFKGEAVKYAWYFGDESSSEQVSPTYTFKYTKNYVVQVKILDKSNSVYYGKTEARFEGAGVLTTACKALFTATVVPLSTGTATGSKKVSFKNLSSGEIKECLWTFGDATQSAEVNPVHEFTKYGEYKVCLVVTTIDGCKSDYCQTVKLPDPTLPVMIYRKGYVKDLSSVSGCKWGIVVDNTTVLLPVQMAMSFEFKTGQYVEIAYELLTNTVTTCQAGKPVKIAKIAEITDAALCGFDLVIKPKDQIPDTYLFYAISKSEIKSWKWNFGDGAGSDAQNPEHTYGKAGTYEVSCAITTLSGCTLTRSVKLAVQAPALPACPGAVSLTLYDPSSKTVCDGKAVVSLLDPTARPYSLVKYTWSSGATGEKAENLCPNKQYIVTASIEGVCQKSTSFSFISAPVITVINSGSKYGFAVDSPSSDLIYRWEFGDGNVAYGPAVDYVFGTEGNYDVKVTAISGNYSAETIQKVAVINGLTPLKELSRNDLKIFPNPVRDRLWIDFGKPVTGQVDIEITDMKGSKIVIQNMVLNGQKTIEFPAGRLNNGIYFLSVKNKGNIITGMKFLKNR